MGKAIRDGGKRHLLDDVMMEDLQEPKKL